MTSQMRWWHLTFGRGAASAAAKERKIVFRKIWAF